MFDQQYQTIRQSFASLRRDKARHRDIADKLSISEGELIAAHAGAPIEAGESPLQVVRLRAEWPEIIGVIEPLGEVLALTRNAAACTRRPACIGGLAIRSASWDWCWAARSICASFTASGPTDSPSARPPISACRAAPSSSTPPAPRFLRPASDVHAYDALVDRFTAAGQATGMTVVASAPGRKRQRLERRTPSKTLAIDIIKDNHYHYHSYLR